MVFQGSAAQAEKHLKARRQHCLTPDAFLELVASMFRAPIQMTARQQAMLANSFQKQSRQLPLLA
jgi:hypothetical protein